MAFVQYLYFIVASNVTLYSDPSTAGVASHSLDYRKSAGGFIHGYRYTGKTQDT